MFYEIISDLQDLYSASKAGLDKNNVNSTCSRAVSHIQVMLGLGKPIIPSEAMSPELQFSHLHIVQLHVIPTYWLCCVT